MKSLSATRRPSLILLIGAGVILIITALSAVFAVQSNHVTVANVSEVLAVDPVATKPSISSQQIEKPAESVQVPIAPTTDAAVSAAVQNTAAAQSQVAGSAVAYPSVQISAAQRDRLLVVAASISLIGMSLYAMSMLTVTAQSVPATRRPFYKALDS